jgi:hypothetical protein
MTGIAVEGEYTVGVCWEGPRMRRHVMRGHVACAHGFMNVRCTVYTVRPHLDTHVDCSTLLHCLLYYFVSSCLTAYPAVLM